MMMRLARHPLGYPHAPRLCIDPRYENDCQRSRGISLGFSMIVVRREAHLVFVVTISLNSVSAILQY